MFDNILKWLISLLGVGTVLVIGFLIYIGNQGDAISAEESKQSDEVTTNEELVSDFDIESSKVQLVRIERLKEEAFQARLHQMTHQKVKADTKWGQIEMTPENIALMIAILERDGVEYTKEDYYWEVLNAWKNGDFSNAVDVHNTIWEWQGGTIGKATGLLSPEEENRYIESHFR